MWLLPSPFSCVFPNRQIPTPSHLLPSPFSKTPSLETQTAKPSSLPSANAETPSPFQPNHPPPVDSDSGFLFGLIATPVSSRLQLNGKAQQDPEVSKEEKENVVYERVEYPYPGDEEAMDAFIASGGLGSTAIGPERFFLS